MKIETTAKHLKDFLDHLRDNHDTIERGVFSTKGKYYASSLFDFGELDIHDDDIVCSSKGVISVGYGPVDFGVHFKEWADRNGVTYTAISEDFDDGDRLKWLIHQLGEDVLREVMGVLPDTDDMYQWRDRMDRIMSEELNQPVHSHGVSF